MSPIARGALQLYAGPTGDVAPLPFSFGAIDSLAHHDGGSYQLGLVLLALTITPDHGLRDLFDVCLLDSTGVDLMHGCGRARHPRKVSRSIIHTSAGDSPILPWGEQCQLTISGRHDPGSVVGVTMTYAPRVPVGSPDARSEVH